MSIEQFLKENQINASKTEIINESKSEKTNLNYGLASSIAAPNYCMDIEPDGKNRCLITSINNKPCHFELSV